MYKRMSVSLTIALIFVMLFSVKTHAFISLGDFLPDFVIQMEGATKLVEIVNQLQELEQAYRQVKGIKEMYDNARNLGDFTQDILGNTKLGEAREMIKGDDDLSWSEWMDVADLGWDDLVQDEFRKSVKHNLYWSPEGTRTRRALFHWEKSGAVWLTQLEERQQRKRYEEMREVLEEQNVGSYIELGHKIGRDLSDLSKEYAQLQLIYEEETNEPQPEGPETRTEENEEGEEVEVKLSPPRVQNKLNPDQIFNDRTISNRVKDEALEEAKKINTRNQWIQETYSTINYKYNELIVSEKDGTVYYRDAVEDVKETPSMLGFMANQSDQISRLEEKLFLGGNEVDDFETSIELLGINEMMQYLNLQMLMQNQILMKILESNVDGIQLQLPAKQGMTDQQLKQSVDDFYHNFRQ